MMKYVWCILLVTGLMSPLPAWSDSAKVDWDMLPMRILDELHAVVKYYGKDASGRVDISKKDGKYYLKFAYSPAKKRNSSGDISYPYVEMLRINKVFLKNDDEENYSLIREVYSNPREFRGWYSTEIELTPKDIAMMKTYNDITFTYTLRTVRSDGYSDRETRFTLPLNNGREDEFSDIIRKLDEFEKNRRW